MPRVDAALRAAGYELVLLPEGVSEDELARELTDAELLLMCYTPVTARVIGAAPRLKGIVKYGVGIDAIDIEAARARGIAVAALDVYSQEPLARSGHPLSALYAMDNVILSPHLTFYTAEAMQRLEDETLERCFEILEGRPVLVKSADPRLRAQRQGVRFAD